MSEKIYCGTGKKSQYSVKLNLSIDRIPGEWITEAKDGKRYIRLEVSERKAPDQYGNTHSVTVDTWRKPDGSDSSEHASAHQQAKQNGYAPQDSSGDTTDDLPF